MSQNVSLPLWAKVSQAVVAIILVVIAWQYAASWLMLALLFKSKPPIQVLPWTLAEYVIRYHSNKAVMKPAMMGLLLPGAVIFGIPIWLLWPQGKPLHGAARWAKMAEIRANGLFESTGALIGRLGKNFLRLGAAHHIILSAGTGTGKGVSFVIPNLLTMDCSIVCSDIKRLNWGITAGFRKLCGHQVYLFDPTNTHRRTHRWNPLGYISEDPAKRIDDIQKIAQLIYPSDANEKDPMWTASSRSLFLGLVLLLCETPGKLVTLGQVARESYDGDADRIKKLITDRQAAGNPLSNVCLLSIKDYLNSPDKTRESIRKTFTSRLELFLNPNIDAATSPGAMGDVGDFDLRKLRKEKISVFLGVPPSDIARLAPLLNLFYQQLIDLHTQETPSQNKSLKYDLVLLMDEFKALGKMPVLVDVIAFLREYGIRLMPVFQDDEQIIDLYGVHAAKAFFRGFTGRIYFEPVDQESAELVSKQIGQETVKSKSVSTPTMGGKGGSVSKSDAGRPLLTTDDLLSMGTETAIIFVRGMRPIKASKIRYYSDPKFMDRLKLVSPSLKALGKRLPSKAELDAAVEAGELAPTIDPVPLVALTVPVTFTDERPTRPVAAEDMNRLESMSLSDFDIDFSKVEVPAGDMDEDQMAEFAESVYQQILKS